MGVNVDDAVYDARFMAGEEFQEIRRAAVVLAPLCNGPGTDSRVRRGEQAGRQPIMRSLPAIRAVHTVRAERDQFQQYMNIT